MATVATETVNGYAIRPDRGRPEAHHHAPDSRDDVGSLPRNADFPRSASYTYLPEANKDAASYVNPGILTIKGSFSEADLIAPAEDVEDISPPDSSGWTTPEEGPPEPKVSSQETRDLIAQLQKSPKITVQRMARATEEDARSSFESSVSPPSITSTSVESQRTGSTPASTPGSITPRPHGSTSNSFTRRINGRSWYGSSQSSTPSRSPSPPKKEVTIKSHEVGPNGAPAPAPPGKLERHKSLFRSKTAEAKGTKLEKFIEEEPSQPPSRRSTLLRRKSNKPRPVSGLFRRATDEENATPRADSTAVPPVPRMPALPKSFSTEKLPTYVSQASQFDRAAPVPRMLSSERNHPNASHSLPSRKKDELWSVFRGLDGEYTKFASKSVAFKANVVRTSLLPFLRTYATHPSYNSLRPEDLDRRANILNKWWTGLIEMLHGRNNQSISGTDRPVILDGISGIMERPEWRLAPSPFCALNQRTKGMNTPRNQSTTSLASSTSDFLKDSVNHNVRNIFIQNLSAQMAFVVDKMSLRNASASLVTFCGKACAYAFMFVPGMADVLARLWDLQMDTLRRVLDANGIGKFDNLADAAASVISRFPPAMQQLGFASLMKYMRKLRTPPPLPLGTANVQWWGHWLERWSGRESDLFYVFVKHYHILATDFLPPQSSMQDRMCAPGMLLVHAQILVNLDATIHREAAPAQQDPAAAGPSPTFDDVMADPDAVATALPLPPTNAIRIMAENRLIMLIRDFLSERTADHPIARDLFAVSFNVLLQSAAKGTSIYDHAACYTLLDFLEEALVILVRYESIKETEGTIINSEFWHTVCKKMISSHNTMTEIRLYAFLYTVWNTVVSDPERRSNMCVRLLLDPEIFESRFNHWCPMVRAYFMRLLCWRLARYDGGAQSGDLWILETLHERLQTAWSHYLYLREQASHRKGLLPPTNPCNPAPGRRLLIIRTDTHLAPASSFLSFDGVVSSTPHEQSQLPSKRFSTLSAVVEMDSRPDTSCSNAESEFSPEPRERGIGGFFRKMMGGSKNRSKSQGPSRKSPKEQRDMPMSAPATPTPEPRNPLTRAATEPIEDLQTLRRGSSTMDHAVKSAMTPQHRNFCFKFSLEYLPNSKHVPGPMRLHPPRLPVPAQNFLSERSPKMQSRSPVTAVEPTGSSAAHARYCGRALAEWTIVVGECQSFFERRRSEGVPNNKAVETPTLGVEVFRRPG